MPSRSCVLGFVCLSPTIVEQETRRDVTTPRRTPRFKQSITIVDRSLMGGEVRGEVGAGGGVHECSAFSFF